MTEKEYAGKVNEKLDQILKLTTDVEKLTAEFIKDNGEVLYDNISIPYGIDKKMDAIAAFAGLIEDRLNGINPNYDPNSRYKKIRKALGYTNP